jgi:hypothetical protein
MAICFTFLNQPRSGQMSVIWERANKISELGYKIHNAAMVVAMVAEDLVDNAQSGACWCASDCLLQISDEIDEEVSALMSANRQQEELIQKLEAKVAKLEKKK